MAPHDDPNAHRNPDSTEAPLDGANRSLSEALRASFGALKGIMLVLFVLYLFSNVRSLGSHEQALVLRLGRLLPDVHEAGLVWAFPFPIDEIVPLPTRKSNDLLITSHTFHRRDEEVGRPLSFISRGEHQGLNPSLDGALLTADAGLVHAQWKVTYKFNKVEDFVRTIHGDKVETAENMIRTLVETVGIQVAGERTAEEAIRTQVDHVQREMKRRINERLAQLGTGLVLTLVEMYEPTPPIQVRSAFDATLRAESTRQQMIRARDKDRTRILNEAAGAAHARLTRLLDEIDRGGSDGRTVPFLRDELDRMLEEEVEGEAGKRIKAASSYRATVVSRMQSDVERYRTLLPEYKRNPMMLINRLWEETKHRIFEASGVTKIYLPPGLQRITIKVPLDPEQERKAETKRLIDDEFDAGNLIKERLVPVGPEYD